MFVHGLFGHPRRTWTGALEAEKSLTSRSKQRETASRPLEQSSTNGKLSVATDSDVYPEVNNEASASGTSLQGQPNPRSSLMSLPQIVGLRMGEVFWPASLLPSVLPEARVFTWGYDADVDAFNGSVGHNTVEQHATDLLTDIANLLDKFGEVGNLLDGMYENRLICVVSEAYHLCCAQSWRNCSQGSEDLLVTSWLPKGLANTI